jgi:hypothetical protein
MKMKKEFYACGRDQGLSDHPWTLRPDYLFKSLRPDRV